MDSGRLFYDDEYDALNTAVSNSGRELKAIAQAIWPGMKADSAYAKIKACLNRLGDQQFKFHEYIALMRFCGQYDPLFYICDETLHARPPRIAPEDEEVKLVEALTCAIETVNRATAALERLKDRERKPTVRAA
jgi:hypothetical protein